MRIAVLTSGGDAPGMNPAIRAVTRCAHAAGATIFAVHEGYDGLVNGDIELLAPSDVSGLLDRGGTCLGTARSETFRSQAGRRSAVKHLAQHGIEGLIVIGGDGSLTGAQVLASEWSQHAAVLRAEGVIDGCVDALGVVGLVGSIDNDFCGTDATIGADSALHRVVGAIDALTSTAASHQRSFVVEVMGRACGWLALAAAVCTGADAVLIPEAPPDDWRSTVKGALAAGRAAGRRHAVVLVAEGARDASGNPLSCEQVRAFMQDTLHLDTRITVLGHVQRGGAASSYDRVMTTILGAHAVDYLLRAQHDTVVMTTEGPRVEALSLTEGVQQSREASQAVHEGLADRALALRGAAFTELVRLQRVLSTPTQDTGQDAIAIVHVGAPAPGMNAAVAASARVALARGFRALGVHEGLRGLAAGRLAPLDWMAVDGWIERGGAHLGTNRHVADAHVLQAIRGVLAHHHVKGIVLVGGFEALGSAQVLSDLDVPLAVVPATISSNVPGTWRTVGSDTACNAIIEAVDRLRQSAVGARNRVFVIEVMGRRCGALAAAAGLGSGAEIVLTHEDQVGLRTIQRASDAMNTAFDGGRKVGLVVVSDGVPEPYDARSVATMLQAESGGRFDTRLCVLGHLQQGGRPSPADRLAGARLGLRAAEHVLDHANAIVVGLDGQGVSCRPLQQVLAASDLHNRRPATPLHTHVLDLARRLGV